VQEGVRMSERGRERERGRVASMCARVECSYIRVCVCACVQCVRGCMRACVGI
jgi:hypothetical protein